jgi:hypothetical protein
VEADLVRKDLAAREGDLKEELRLEFEFESLNRELDAFARLVGDLQMDLERTRMQMAGTVTSATVQKPPSLPLIASSLSIPRRASFGLVVGAALILSLLFLFDLANPRLLSSDDLDGLKIGKVGVVDVLKDPLPAIASTLSALAPPRRDRPEGTPQVLAFHALGPDVDLEGWIEDLAQTFTGYGLRTAAAVITDAGGDGFRWSARIAGLTEVHRLHPEEVPFSYADLLAALAVRGFDKILVFVATGAGAAPWRGAIQASSDAVFLLTAMGRSELKTLERFKSPEKAVYAMVVAA